MQQIIERTNYAWKSILCSALPIVLPPSPHRHKLFRLERSLPTLRPNIRRTRFCSTATRRQRLEARARHPSMTLLVDRCPHERLHHGLDTEGAGLHWVLEEVGLEEPLARVDVLLRARTAQARGRGRRPIAANAVDHGEHR